MHADVDAGTEAAGTGRAVTARKVARGRAASRPLRRTGVLDGSICEHKGVAGMGAAPAPCTETTRSTHRVHVRTAVPPNREVRAGSGSSFPDDHPCARTVYASHSWSQPMGRSRGLMPARHAQERLGWPGVYIKEAYHGKRQPRALEARVRPRCRGPMAARAATCECMPLTIVEKGYGESPVHISEGSDDGHCQSGLLRAGVLVFDSAGRLLLLQSYGNKWGVAKGAVRDLHPAGETPRSAAARELWEETGMRCCPEELSALDAFSISETEYFFFQTRREQESMLGHRSSECTALAWVCPLCCDEKLRDLRGGRGMSAVNHASRLLLARILEEQRNLEVCTRWRHQQPMAGRGADLDAGRRWRGGRCARCRAAPAWRLQSADSGTDACAS